jgi:AbrB family looped-hinge helix DNA binding protein
METTVDRFGRIILPKSLRDILGLEPGDQLRIEQIPGGIQLRPLNHEAPASMQEGVLVFSGMTEQIIENAVNEPRHKQMRRSHFHLRKP